MTVAICQRRNAGRWSADLRWIFRKYKVKVGDTILLKEAYGKQEYELTVKGIFQYPGALSVFMSMGEFREIFGKSDDYFNGYFTKKRSQIWMRI